MKYYATMAALCVAPLAAPAMAQDTDHTDHTQMDHSKMDHNQTAPEASDHADHSAHEGGADAPFQSGSGTSRLPGKEGANHGVMLTTGDWSIMAHGNASLQYTDHNGPRGDAMPYVTSMAMIMAQRDTEWGGITLKSMVSLEPAMDARGYPNLFATGETAGGEALVDRQHPHDLFMELAAQVHFTVGDSGQVFVYGGPVGEPAIGPSAFMHRGSARNNPEPPITHHWFDSSHITYGVVTLGYSAPLWQLEASAFRGAEPDERRWNIETPKLDSWSVRGTLTPTPNWAVQASYAKIRQPEALHPNEDEGRFTASAHYGDGRLNGMMAFSAKNRMPGGTLTAWLAEADFAATDRISVFGRFENVANDELFPDHDDPLHDQKFRVSKFQVGAAYRLPLSNWSSMTVGASGSIYAAPSTLDAAYGTTPTGFTVFARLNFGQ